MTHPSVPVELAVAEDSAEETGDRFWQPISSTFGNSDIAWLESRVGVRLPEVYTEFLKYKHFLEMRVGPVDFFRFAPATWRSDFEDEYSNWAPERILGTGLVPFGLECFAEAGPVCFDTRIDCVKADYPVVFWDHEWVGTGQEVRPMFSSASAMFRCLRSCVGGPTSGWFFHADEGESAEMTASKRQRLAEFLELDPNGAGGPARQYFTSWGIEP